MDLIRSFRHVLHGVDHRQVELVVGSLTHDLHPYHATEMSTSKFRSVLMVTQPSPMPRYVPVIEWMG